MKKREISQKYTKIEDISRNTFVNILEKISYILRSVKGELCYM